MEEIEYKDFEKIEIRTGTIIAAENFPGAKKPSYKLTIDFGEYGIRNSSAQITILYSREQLVGKQIVAIINFPAKQIANYLSECLILGVENENGDVVLLKPEMKVQNGKSIY